MAWRIPPRHCSPWESVVSLLTEGLVTRGLDLTLFATVDYFVDIHQGTLHKIENTGKEELAFIEVQTGDYFGEEDIERIEDDFGRT